VCVCVCVWVGRGQSSIIMLQRSQALDRTGKLWLRSMPFSGLAVSQLSNVFSRQAAFEEGLRALEAEARKGVTRLRATEGFLGQCLSSKAIGIRQREAEALRVRQDKDLTARLAELTDKTHAAITRMTDANRKFEVGLVGGWGRGEGGGRRGVAIHIGYVAVLAQRVSVRAIFLGLAILASWQ
jgi:hypothetical protein